MYIKVNPKTQKDYIELFRELWTWLSAKPGREKNAWPRWKKNGGDLEYMLARCPLCEYASSIAEHGLDSEYCHLCPVTWPSLEPTTLSEDSVFPCSVFPCRASIFGQWEDAIRNKNYTEAAHIAKQISELPEKNVSTLQKNRRILFRRFQLSPNEKEFMENMKQIDERWHRREVLLRNFTDLHKKAA